MRILIWIPRTGFGLVASGVAGAVIGAVAYVLVGSPTFNVPVGSAAYNRQEQALLVILIAAVVGGTWIGTRLERRRLIRNAMATRPNVARPTATSPALPATLDEALSRISMGPTPAGMGEPRTDANFAMYARSLATATWGDWQVIHIRVKAISQTVNIYQSLIGRVGEVRATSISNAANMAGTAVNSLVLGHFVREIDEAQVSDLRLARTWLDLLDEQDGPPTGAVVRGAWGVLLRDTLPVEALNDCYQPFARSVVASVFGLEEDAPTSTGTTSSTSR